MLDQFARQDRWWLDPGEIHRERHLRRFRTSEERRSCLVEVKYQRQVDERDARTLIGEGGGVLVNRAFDGDFAEGAVCALPAADALVLLDGPALAPVRR